MTKLYICYITLVRTVNWRHRPPIGTVGAVYPRKLVTLSSFGGYFGETFLKGLFDGLSPGYLVDILGNQLVIS